MNASIPALSSLACMIVSAIGAEVETLGSVERLDGGLDKLLAADAVIEVLASGFDWSEGPVWDGANERILFSDVPRNTIYQWSAKDGLSEFMKPSGFTGVGRYSGEPGSNGLAMDADGRLYFCEHGDRRVSVMAPGEGKRTLADRFEGKRFNSPNDLVIHPGGAVYFTDPPYGLPQRERSKNRELDWFGVYRVAPDGEVLLVTKELSRPNGIALSPDGETLFVAQSDSSKPVVMAYPLEADGSAGPGKVFFDARSLRGRGLPDGLKVDREGNLWCTGPGGVLVIDSGGKLLGRILTGQATANCAWGDDGSSLFITADAYLCRIRTLTKGAGW